LRGLAGARDGGADDAARVMGNMHDRPPFDAHQFRVLDLDRLYMMEFGRRRGFGHMHGAAAECSAARCNRRQFCQGHPYRHDRALPPSTRQCPSQTGIDASGTHVPLPTNADRIAQGNGINHF